jgi:hypothetical protein
LGNFSVFVGVAVNHVIRSDGIEHLSSNQYYYVCVCVV